MSCTVYFSSASPTFPHFSLTLGTRMKRNQTVQLGQRGLGNRTRGKDGLIPTGTDRTKDKNDFLKQDLLALTQLVNLTIREK